MSSSTTVTPSECKFPTIGTFTSPDDAKKSGAKITSGEEFQSKCMQLTYGSDICNNSNKPQMGSSPTQSSGWGSPSNEPICTVAVSASTLGYACQDWLQSQSPVQAASIHACFAQYCTNNTAVISGAVCPSNAGCKVVPQDCACVAPEQVNLPFQPEKAPGETVAPPAWSYDKIMRWAQGSGIMKSYSVAPTCVWPPCRAYPTSVLQNYIDDCAKNPSIVMCSISGSEVNITGSTVNGDINAIVQSCGTSNLSCSGTCVPAVEPDSGQATITIIRKFAASRKGKIVLTAMGVLLLVFLILILRAVMTSSSTHTYVLQYR